MREDAHADKIAAIPEVEIHIASRRTGAAAGGAGDSRLSQQQIAAIQETLTSLVSGFRPPEEAEAAAAFRIESLEIAIGFKIETGAGPVLKLILDAKAEASINAKIVWGRAKK